MEDILKGLYSNKESLYWEDSLKFSFLIQKRLFKSIFVGDLKTALALQKLIINSNSSRLLAIRYVTQICVNRKMAGVDGKNSLTFVERFELNEFLKLNVSNWFSQNFRSVSLLKNDNVVKKIKLSTISDRVWQFLITMAIEPIHEALFYPASVGFRSGYNAFDVQKLIYFNLMSSANGLQKRCLIFNLKDCFIHYNLNYLLKKIIAPRSIKISLNRLFSLGFPIQFSDEFDQKFNYNLESLCANILLNGIELIHNSIRFGYFLAFFLNPLDNEKKILNFVYSELNIRGLEYKDLKITFVSSLDGFDFLGWNFKVLYNKNVYIVPALPEYQKFLRRLKHIINNSNFGSTIKANKIYPIIREWRLYHRFSSLVSSRFSLFLIKKRAFKIFSKESRQDFYSTKRLLDKCFYILSDSDKIFYDFEKLKSPYFGHLTFRLNFKKNSFFNSNSMKNKIYLCFHCGMKSLFY